MCDYLNITPKRHRNIKNIARSYFNHYKTRNPFEIFQKLGISCSLIKLDGDLKGFTHINEKNIPCVYINNKYDYYSQKIIAAHELGHILLHRKDALNMFEENGISSQKEYEANIFLMEFMPQVQPHDKNYIQLSPTRLKNYIRSKIC